MVHRKSDLTLQTACFRLTCTCHQITLCILGASLIGGNLPIGNKVREWVFYRRIKRHIILIGIIRIECNRLDKFALIFDRISLQLPYSFFIERKFTVGNSLYYLTSCHTIYSNNISCHKSGLVVLIYRTSVRYALKASIGNTDLKRLCHRTAFHTILFCTASKSKQSCQCTY